MKNIAIIGTGLSGQMAALACHDLHQPFDWYGPALPKVMADFPASLFMHKLPRSIIPPGQQPSFVQIRTAGTREDFIFKQWGYGSHVPVLTFDQAGENWTMWRITDYWNWAEEYAALLDIPVQPTPALIDADLIALKEQYHLVFHSFPTQQSSKDRLEPFTFGITTFPFQGEQNGWLLYMGDKSPITRISYLDNRMSIEYTLSFSMSNSRMFTQWGRILHPSITPCTELLAPGIIPIGRWATWNKTYFAHNAYETVFTELTGESSDDQLA